MNGKKFRGQKCFKDTREVDTKMVIFGLLSSSCKNSSKTNRSIKNIKQCYTTAKVAVTILDLKACKKNLDLL